MAGLLWAAAVSPAWAQFTNNRCGTAVGMVCSVNPAAVGSPCGCLTPYGVAPGQILGANSSFGASATATGMICRIDAATACATAPSPIGAPCTCKPGPGKVSAR